jgi:hypothetical protein
MAILISSLASRTVDEAREYLESSFKPKLLEQRAELEEEAKYNSFEKNR